MAKNKIKKTGTIDKHLSLISITLGAASIFSLLTFFSGIPAIIIGIIALKKNAPDAIQAKIGIVLGIIGSLLIVPIVMVAFYFLREPIKEQGTVPLSERQNITAYVKALKQFKSKHGRFPKCNEYSNSNKCADWTTLLSENNGLKPYSTSFEEQATNIEDRPAGTLVYAMNSTCFVNTPVYPYDDNDDLTPKKNPEDYAAIVYFHEKGRACYSTEQID